MAALDSQRRRALSICATLPVVALLLVGATRLALAQPANPEPGQAEGSPPKASLQDAPDLVIFHTGEVKGALIPGG